MKLDELLRELESAKVALEAGWSNVVTTEELDEETCRRATTGALLSIAQSQYILAALQVERYRVSL